MKTLVAQLQERDESLEETRNKNVLEPILMVERSV